ncbi:AraC family transcriptional regulator [Flavobacterium sp. LS1R49]|uniref:AraC family transcriptional regulator n=1 Tax=Flavobacterium shii TaxID=2987687 RepID=A0A9X2Z8Y5_9FLAO|nr:AraC family transcriptional regulator [Flavobacterium shii]MCV9926124.1 AraC family transcriptional regulator [Flavobacterium shii]
MDKFDFLNLIATIAVFVSLLFAFFLLTVKTKNKLANRLFAIFLLLNALDTSGFLNYSFINLDYFRLSFYLLSMPIFYLYVISLCYNDFQLKPKHLLHTIPFVVFNLVLTPRLYLANDADKKYFFEHLQQMPEIYFSHIIGELQYAFYIIAIFLTLKKYKEIYLENYANPNTSLYKWLLQIMVCFLIAHSIVITRDLLRYSDYNEIFIGINVIIGIGVLFITCWFVLKALNNPELFRGIDSKLQLVKDILPESENNLIIQTHIALLKKYMEEEEPFLEPSLTIQELATQIKMPVRDLSILINHHMNLHFFDFVNEYRIKKAMKILSDPSKKNLTVLEILYEVGFNSKSSFNTSFKKYTNLTPTAFRSQS